jgi:hypothetical protein
MQGDVGYSTIRGFVESSAVERLRPDVALAAQFWELRTFFVLYSFLIESSYLEIYIHHDRPNSFTSPQLFAYSESDNLYLIA